MLSEHPLEVSSTKIKRVRGKRASVVFGVCVLLLPGLCAGQVKTAPTKPVSASPTVTTGSLATASMQQATVNARFVTSSGTQGLGSFQSMSGSLEATAVEQATSPGVTALGNANRAKVIGFAGGEDMTQYKYLVEWKQAMEEGKPSARDVLVIVNSPEGREVARYLLHQALLNNLSLAMRAGTGGSQLPSYSVSYSYQQSERLK